jgi:hypothetical protein
VAVILRLSDAELATNLRNFLERRQCAVVQLQAESFEVTLPHELDAEEARRELDLYLRVWQSLHDWPSIEFVTTGSR